MSDQISKSSPGRTLQRVLRLQQLTILLNVSEPTIWRWVAEGNLPKFFKLSPGVTVWDAEEIYEWLQDKKAARVNEVGGIESSSTAPVRNRNPVPASTNSTRRKPGRPRKVALKVV